MLTCSQDLIEHCMNLNRRQKLPTSTRQQAVSLYCQTQLWGALTCLQHLVVLLEQVLLFTRWKKCESVYSTNWSNIINHNFISNKIKTTENGNLSNVWSTNFTIYVKHIYENYTKKLFNCPPSSKYIHTVNNPNVVQPMLWWVQEIKIFHLEHWNSFLVILHCLELQYICNDNYKCVHCW